jgi:hypothetical protein
MRLQQDFCDVAITHEHASADWKSCVGKLTVGSNPTLSARRVQVNVSALSSGKAERVSRWKDLTTKLTTI